MDLGESYRYDGHMDSNVTLEEIALLRAQFEKQLNDSYGFRQSRRGVYVNPTVQSRWSWFLRGYSIGRSSSPP